ncbi:nuclear transport factor 2 family protein [Lutimaribacter saemankumensis]|uniref:Putative lumazine-binding n=1 Tax=Lutimaribacter saemankumensis TaxID=490829 RepID=A0A1G8I4N8_9RHOB|nr:nuclear transport factor 2 family protein [Lutimaribacter saemankumensis]SDI13935.1 Putative lumazine-binding [Lutimaribacter saemankumensis]
MTLPVQEVAAQARAYCEALHRSDASVFEAMCDEAFLMTFVAPDGTSRVIDKAAFVARVAGRDPFAGDPSYHIETVDVAGPDIAHVKLWVDMPPRRYLDYLGFFHVGGEWKLVTKLFRTASGPALEG